MAERQVPAIPGSCPPYSYRSLFIHSRPRANALYCLLTQAGPSLMAQEKQMSASQPLVFLFGSLYLIVFLVTFSYSEGKSLTCHFIAFQIFIIGSDLIDQLAVNDLHDTVGSGLYDLVVTG